MSNIDTKVEDTGCDTVTVSEQLELIKNLLNPLRFNPGKTGIFFTPRKRSIRAKPGFFLPPPQTFNPGKTGILQTLSKGSHLAPKIRLRVDKSSSGLLLRCNMMQ